jgi:hypothetical protein
LYNFFYIDVSAFVKTKRINTNQYRQIYMKKDVMVGYPCYDGKAEVGSIGPIYQAATSKDNPVKQIQYLNGDSLVSRARNKIAERFLASDCEYLMFIDNDILFQPEDITRLRAYGRDIVGGVYLKKKLPYSAVANRNIATDDVTGLLEMAEIGTGFMMISRRAFERIIEEFGTELQYKAENDETVGAYYDFFRVGVNSEGRYLSEDYFFCELARKVGIKVWLDSGILVKHKGHAVYPFDDNTFLEACADFIEKYNPAVPIDPALLNRIEAAIISQREERGWI